ncbi:MAG: IPT/TIG domain-containing protein, partial [Deltaproteobacteria bacterium]|nr:IPT/TIG domain-containing protein [Deltaproteobacteria bacterium]
KRPATEVSEEQEAEQDIQQSGEDAQAEPEENYGEAVDGGTEAGEVIEKLSILSVSPPSGKAQGGETVIIKGSGFGKDAVVIFDQSKAVFFAVMDSNMISCVTPPHPPGAVDLYVMSSGETAFLEKGYAYFNELSIDSVKPQDIPVSGGVPVTITGKGFDKETKFYLGEKEVIAMTVFGDTEAFGIAPANFHGFKKAIAAKGSKIAVMNKAVFYYFEPLIQKIFPPAGTISGGTEVIVSGQGFYEGMEILFGDKNAGDVSVIDTLTVMVKTPSNPAGHADVTVETTYGKFLFENGFYYFDPLANQGAPVIHSIKPDYGETGGTTQIYITVSGLTSKEDTQVLVCGKEAAVIDFKKDEFYLTAVAPENPKGFCDVAIKNSNGESTVKNGFQYVAPLVLYGLTPSEGDSFGGTPVVVQGEGFTDDTDIFIGTLPLSGKEFKTSQVITGKTPPSSPGKADLSAVRGQDKSVLKNAFTYLSEPGLNLIYPDQGSITGGTLVKLFGSSFGGDIEIYFGDKKASHLIAVSDTIISVQTPPNDIGTVDVRLIMNGGIFLLPQAFTYYDPESLLGGTWGGEIEGTLNITVKDAGSGAPVAEAYVILWVDSDTPYQGFTNSMGQIAFTGDDLEGWQMVSASRECYENTSVVKFNAKNITVFIQYTCPSPGMPPSVAPGQVSGRVIGLDKYVQAPPGNCWYKGVGSDGISCKPCYLESDCGDLGDCIQIGSAGKFCGKPCAVQSDCLEGYMCVKSAENFVSCVPAAGKKNAYCETTAPYMLAENPPPGPGKQADENGNYSITTRLGEIAIVCLGGIDDPDTGLFTPYVMGVKRHLFVPPGGVLENQD